MKEAAFSKREQSTWRNTTAQGAQNEKNFNMFRLNGTPRTKTIFSRFMDNYRRGQEVIGVEDYLKKMFSRHNRSV